MNGIEKEWNAGMLAVVMRCVLSRGYVSILCESKLFGMMVMPFNGASSVLSFPTQRVSHQNNGIS